MDEDGLVGKCTTKLEQSIFSKKKKKKLEQSMYVLSKKEKEKKKEQSMYVKLVQLILPFFFFGITPKMNTH